MRLASAACREGLFTHRRRPCRLGTPPCRRTTGNNCRRLRWEVFMTALQRVALLAALCAIPLTHARSEELKDFGSFHVGGRQVSLSGYPVTESVFTAGAAPTRVDPNGDFEVEQMYVQYLIPANQAAKYPLLMWHGGGLTGVTWETKPDGKP